LCKLVCVGAIGGHHVDCVAERPQKYPPLQEKIVKLRRNSCEISRILGAKVERGNCAELPDIRKSIVFFEWLKLSALASFECSHTLANRLARPNIEIGGSSGAGDRIGGVGA